MASAGIERDEEVATASLLMNASGVRRNIFPKTYHTRLTWGFFVYLLLVTVFVFGFTGYVYQMPNSDMNPIVFLVDVAYMVLVFSVIFLQVPRSVVRENERILISFLCRTRVVPIQSIIEIRMVRRRKPGQNCCKGSICKYPLKCFWGYPTNFDRNIIVVTNTTCNNYFFCLKEMEEFLADNWPDAEDAPAPEVLGSSI